MKNLVTKLQESVNDVSILKMDEIRIDVKSASVWKAESFHFQLESTGDIEVSIIGGGYFTDSNGTANLGTKYPKQTYTSLGRDIYVSNNTCQVSIVGKTLIKILNLNPIKSLTTKINLSLNINQINYMDNLELLQTIGDLAQPVKGYIDFIGNLPRLSELVLSSNKRNTLLNGDISKMYIPNIIILRMNNSDVYGNIKSINELNNLERFEASSTKISGKISEVKNSRLKEIAIYNTGVELDNLGVLPQSCGKINCSGEANWGKRTGYIISITGRPQLSNQVDMMLINQSTLSPNPSDESKIIDVDGYKTSHSDEAVSILKSKGYTVKVNGAII